MSHTRGVHDTPADAEKRLHLVLYIMDNTPNSRKAEEHIRMLCEQLPECTMEVVDVQDTPERAREDQIIAIPTLVKKIPEPQARVLGDLSDVDQVRRALGLGGAPHGEQA